MQTSPEQSRWREQARAFAEEIKPTVDPLERKAEFPLEHMKRLGKLGLLGVAYPKEYGGQGADTFSMILCVEEITKVWASLGLSIGAHMLGMFPILCAGTESQKKKYLTPLVLGEKLGAFGLTEPGSGSDAGGGQTVAEKTENGFVINGKKIFTTSATYASTYIVSAISDKSLGKKGISAFIVERDCSGLAIAKKEQKLGLWASDTAGLILDSCRVPLENILGEPGKGFHVFLQTLDAGRLGIAGWCYGIADAAFESLLTWAKETGIKTGLMENYEYAGGALAELATQLEAAQGLIRNACQVKDAGQSYTKQASMAKYFASKVAVAACDVALKLIGYEALTTRLPVERFFRDAKLGTIGEGTSEIQKLVIAREVLKEAAA